MIRIGLTGGIASGKSSVANWFREKGLTVIDADQIAHTLMADMAVISAVEQEFGAEYIENGRINRSLLGNKVFQDKEMKKRLEKLLHPLIYQEMQRQAAEAEIKKEKSVILDIPLLFETVGTSALIKSGWSMSRRISSWQD
jgi:dephospho-CoA kinase